jgi:DNA-binding transcriptional LysR family regulator
MEIDALRILVEAARRGSFAAVSRERGVDPSAVSRAVATVEQELGVRLLQRTTRRMTLTEAGEIYLKRVEGILHELDTAQEDAANASSGPSGHLRLTTSITFGACYLAPLLPAFRSAYPKLTLELLLSDDKLDLVAARIDLAIRLGPSAEASVISTKLFDTRYGVYASPQFLRAAPPLRAPADLAKIPCLLYTFPQFRSRWLFRDGAGVETEVPVHGDVSISNALTLRDCAIRGMGPALLPEWLVQDELRRGDLVELFPRHRAAVTSFDAAAWLLYPSRVHLPHKVRAMIDFLKGSREPSRSGSRAPPESPP